MTAAEYGERGIEEGGAIAGLTAVEYGERGIGEGGALSVLTAGLWMIRHERLDKVIVESFRVRGTAGTWRDRG